MAPWTARFLVAAATLIAGIVPQLAVSEPQKKPILAGLYYYRVEVSDRPVVIGMLANGVDDPASVEYSLPSSFMVDDVSLKIVNFATTREGEEFAYASFTSDSLQPNESDLAFVRIRLEDGLSTQADVGVSSTRTSPDFCGAAAVGVKKVDALVWKQSNVG
jgi:hypothetical protein